MAAPILYAIELELEDAPTSLFQPVRLHGAELAGASTIEEFAGRTYAHTEAAASAVWIIAHNLNSTDLLVQTWDDSVVPPVAIPAANITEIEATNADTITVTFTVPKEGRAIVWRP